MGGDEHNRYAYSRCMSRQEVNRRRKKAHTAWLNSIRKAARR